MLKHRLLFGTLMILVIIALGWVDNQLDHLDISGTVLQDLFLGRTYLPAGLLTLVVLLVIAPLAARELCTIFRAKGIQTDPGVLGLAAVIGVLSVYIIPIRASSPVATAAVATMLLIVFVTALVRHAFPTRRADGAVAVAAATMFTLVYLGLLPGFFIAIRRWHSTWVILAIIFIAKSCDIGAYFTGRFIGRHKLIPWLSPNKTWEGLAGGVVFSGLIAVLLVLLGEQLGGLGRWVAIENHRVWEPYEIPLWLAGVGGALIGLVGHGGDLIASLFKRDADIKDSGQAVPGFGGIIDVIDSAIIVAPLAYWLLILLP